MSTRRIVVPPYQPTTITPTNAYKWPGPGFLVITGWGQNIAGGVTGVLHLNITDASGQAKTVIYYQNATSAYNTVVTNKGIMNPGDQLSNNVASFTPADLGGYDVASAVQCANLALAVAIA